VEALERLVVHVEEALRFAGMQDDPHLRLGLLLLDSAAEVLLHRECQSRLQWAERDRQLVRQADELKAQTGKEMEWVAELREKIVPPSYRRKIDRDFGVKCDYLAGLGLLAAPHARVLKKLHRYRNEAYHRDQLRQAHWRAPSRSTPTSFASSCKNSLCTEPAGSSTCGHARQPGS
jgi:hypothetical protein